jgi:hypothetical protein
MELLTGVITNEEVLDCLILIKQKTTHENSKFWFTIRYSLTCKINFELIEQSDSQGFYTYNKALASC